MRPTLICILALAGCRGILDIPSEGKLGCPAPCMVTVSGRAVPAESVDTSQLALANVTVDLTSLDPSREVITEASGAYSFSGLQPGTPIAFNLSVPQTNPNVQGLLDTRYVVGTTEMRDLALDLPVVQYRWLANVAFQCGIFATLNQALFDVGTMNLNDYFLTRATIIGQVFEEDGSRAKLDRSDISVVIDDFVNRHQNPADTAPQPATLCFLEPDPQTGQYRGVNASQTTSGRFVLFRARNMLGTGTGMGEVQIPGFPPGELDVSSGSIGFVHIRRGDSTSLPERPFTFERDVYHFFKDKTCSDVCHRPPDGIGYVTAPARPGPNGLMYHADWSASVDAVFDNLTKPFDTDCAQSDDTPARVCRALPMASLLYQKPGGLIYHSGLNLGTKDEMVVSILRWIEDGAILR
ncbi:MAG TPA: carboxypeptidase-like regulatory domain-containing protein [Kofleriaceae bacterium]|jgi:hypothetical protein|nr:carboxypeptidase-like regulatory domain-containing protein [Kofleriaceae bacterium]